MSVKTYFKNLRVLSYFLPIIGFFSYRFLIYKPIPQCVGMPCIAHGIGQIVELVIFFIPILLIACALNILNFVKTKPNVSLYRKIELGFFVFPIFIVVLFILGFFISNVGW